MLAAGAGLAIAAGMVAVVLLGQGHRRAFDHRRRGCGLACPTWRSWGRLIFTRYLWAFELTSVLLVIAVVGAVTLARHRHDAMVDADQPGDSLDTEAERDGEEVAS